MKFSPAPVDSNAAEYALTKILIGDLGLVEETELKFMHYVLSDFLSTYLSFSRFESRFDFWAFDISLKYLFSSSRLFFMRFSFNSENTQLILKEFLNAYLSKILKEDLC